VKNPFQDPVFGPPVETHIDRMPGAEGFGEGTPGTGVFGHVDDGVNKSGVVNGYVSPLAGKKQEYFLPLLCGQFHGIRYHFSLA
jgi:hypothetical protein